MSLSAEGIIALVSLLVMSLCIPGLLSFIRRLRLFQQARDAALALFRNGEDPTVFPLHNRLDTDRGPSHPPQREFGAGRLIVIRRTSDIQFAMYAAPPWPGIIASMPEEG